MNTLTEALSKLEKIEEPVKENKIRLSKEQKTLKESLMRKVNQVNTANCKSSFELTKAYEKALQEGINNVYPDIHWSDVTKCDIFSTLLTSNNDIDETVNRILFETKKKSNLNTLNESKVKEVQESVKSKKSLKEEKGYYDSEPYMEKIAYDAENGYFRGEVDGVDWEITFNGHSCEDFKSLQFMEYMLNEVSFPIRVGHLNYYDIDCVISREYFSDDVKEDLKNIFGLEDGDFEEFDNGGDLEFWYEYDVDFDTDEWERINMEDAEDGYGESLKPQKKKLSEGRWDYTLQSGRALRDAIESGDLYYVKNALVNSYKELEQAGIIDEYDCEQYCEEVEEIDTDDEGAEELLDYELNDFYDLCDNSNVWVSLTESLDEDVQDAPTPKEILQGLKDGMSIGEASGLDN